MKVNKVRGVATDNGQWDSGIATIRRNFQNNILFILFIFLNVYLFSRQRETEHEQGRGRETETESEAGPRLRTISTEPDAGLELTSCEIMT